MDLDGAVVTSDALHTVRANLDWLVKDKKAHVGVRTDVQSQVRANVQRLRRVVGGG